MIRGLNAGFVRRHRFRKDRLACGRLHPNKSPAFDDVLAGAFFISDSALREQEIHGNASKVTSLFQDLFCSGVIASNRARTPGRLSYDILVSREFSSLRLHTRIRSASASAQGSFFQQQALLEPPRFPSDAQSHNFAIFPCMHRYHRLHPFHERSPTLQACIVSIVIPLSATQFTSDALGLDRLTR